MRSGAEWKKTLPQAGNHKGLPKYKQKASFPAEDAFFYTDLSAPVSAPELSARISVPLVSARSFQTGSSSLKQSYHIIPASGLLPVMMILQVPDAGMASHEKS